MTVFKQIRKAQPAYLHSFRLGPRSPLASGRHSSSQPHSITPTGHFAIRSNQSYRFLENHVTFIINKSNRQSRERERERNPKSSSFTHTTRHASHLFFPINILCQNKNPAYHLQLRHSPSIDDSLHQVKKHLLQLKISVVRASVVNT